MLEKLPLGVSEALEAEEKLFTQAEANTVLSGNGQYVTAESGEYYRFILLSYRNQELSNDY